MISAHDSTLSTYGKLWLETVHGWAD